jgi:transketolase
MNNKETFDFRDKIFSELYQIFKKDKNCILLTNDMGAIGLDILKRKFKKRVINCGISEQNIISLAGGLASEKHHVFIYGIISHLIFRGLEQIKIDLCLDALPVTIIGVGAGLSYGADGPTHHGIEDIGVLQCIPNMNIFNPSDYVSAIASLKYVYNKRITSLIRLDKEKLPSLYKNQKKFYPLKVFGQSKQLAIITTGITTRTGLDLIQPLKEMGISAMLIDVIKLSPFPVDKIRKIIKNTNNIITIDENMKNSSIERFLYSCLNSSGNCFVKNFNLKNKFIFGSASRKWAWNKYNLSKNKILDYIALNKKKFK